MHDILIESARHFLQQPLVLSVYPEQLLVLRFLVHPPALIFPVVFPL